MTIIGSSCKNPKPKGYQSSKSSSVDTLQLDTPEVRLDNIYTRIADSLCTLRGDTSIHFTNKNTFVYPLNLKDTLSCFVFASEVTCGYLPGTCGWDIQVIKKKNNDYHSVFNSCGLFYNRLNEQFGNFHSFLYVTQDGYKIKVRWDGKEFDEKTISINDISFPFVMAVAEATHRNPSDFVIYDPQKKEVDKIPIRIEDIKIGDNAKGKLYTVLFNKNQEVFLFSINPNKAPNIILSGKGNFILRTIPVSGKQYYDIATMPSKNVNAVKMWQYDYKRNKYVLK